MLSITIALFHVLGFISSINAIISTRTSQGAIAWAISLNTFPLVSVPAYWVFGRSKFNGYSSSWLADSTKAHERLDQFFHNIKPYNVQSPTFFPEYEAVKKLAYIPFLHGNKVTLLENGQETYKSIRKGIAQAQSYILFQFYILRPDTIGNIFKEELIQKAKEGLAVYVLYDERGTKDLSKEWLVDFQDAGIQILPFNTRQGINNAFQLNFRNHRKIVVVDGKEAWLGGLNVGDDYLGKDRKLTPWRDTHLRIVGPAALAAQATFFLDWHWASRNLLEDLNWEAQSSPEGDESVLILASGPAGEQETASLFFTNLLNAARHRIWIATPYFIPDAATLTALRLALLKGLEVRIITPALNDNWFVHNAAKVYLSELSGMGAQIYYYDQGFMHQKVMLIDDRLAVIGTVNFDNRSFRLNFEVSAAVADQHFASEVENMLLRDIAHSKKLEPYNLDDRSLWQRFVAKGAALLAPVL